MRARIIGMPLLGGASDGPLTSAEFAKRVIGCMMMAFVKDKELWSVCRIANDFAIRAITAGLCETRVTAEFDAYNPAMIDVDEGNLLVEAPPKYVSH